MCTRVHVHICAGVPVHAGICLYVSHMHTRIYVITYTEYVRVPSPMCKCIRVHVCMCMYINICICICMYIGMHIRMYIYICIHTDMNKCGPTGVYIFTYMCTCIYMYIRMCVYIHRRMLIFLYCRYKRTDAHICLDVYDVYWYAC